MPYLHLDIPVRFPVNVKRDLARRLGRTYAAVMQTTPDLVCVTFRELGEGGVWRCRDTDPVPAIVMSCEVRRGRPPEQRAKLAKALTDLCVEALGIDPTLLTVEFTEHAGNEIYLNVMVDGVLQGQLGRDWTPAETTSPLLQSMSAEKLAAR